MTKLIVIKFVNLMKNPINYAFSYTYTPPSLRLYDSLPKW